jgi:hypothetical protein
MQQDEVIYKQVRKLLDYSLLGYDAVYSGTPLLTFRRILLPQYLYHEDKGSKFFRNVCHNVPDYRASHLRI